TDCVRRRRTEHAADSRPLKPAPHDYPGNKRDRDRRLGVLSGCRHCLVEVRRGGLGTGVGAYSFASFCVPRRASNILLPGPAPPKGGREAVERTDLVVGPQELRSGAVLPRVGPPKAALSKPPCDVPTAPDPHLGGPSS